MFARCRVDFQKTPTKNCRINLSVLGEFSICYLNQIKHRIFITSNLKQILLFRPMTAAVPPTHLDIFNDLGSIVSNSAIGPYREGSSVNITCMSTGGKCLVSSELQMLGLTYNYIIFTVSFPLWLL